MTQPTDTVTYRETIERARRIVAGATDAMEPRDDEEVLVRYALFQERRVQQLLKSQRGEPYRESEKLPAFLGLWFQVP